jgi:hypothetical protein
MTFYLPGIFDANFHEVTVEAIELPDGITYDAKTNSLNVEGVQSGWYVLSFTLTDERNMKTT